ncbi:MAG: carboxypeptidase-like regulatory domain-containing protein [Tannerella sp.]|nr:carboxypeptidase-like regulatory domain-containing protein [Tannerella sp.]
MHIRLSTVSVLFFSLSLSLSVPPLCAQQSGQAIVHGQVKDAGGLPVEFAGVFIKNTQKGAQTDRNGNFSLSVAPGKIILCVQSMGYVPFEQQAELKPDERRHFHIALEEQATGLDEVVVEAKSPVQRVKESSFNVVAIDAKSLQNTTLDLAHAMSRVSGVKIREAGGMGSDLQFSLNGFSGRHVKFFLDGVPMDGMGASFRINNIPVNLAERIEIYKGVVPVGFGADAIGGAVNIVTNKQRRTFVDASYSYGSFNTHRSSVNAGYTTEKGFMVELNAFQNYSDNSYYIENAVKDLETGQINSNKTERIKRFHDTYHNETVILRTGFVNKPFADRLLVSLNIGKTYKETQNGVRQDIVYGQKHSKGQTLMPSLQYVKRNLFVEGLEVNLTANYNKNLTHNIDTATCEYNWRGESKYNNGKIGEQNYQDSKYENKNGNTTFTANYRINSHHSFVVNNVLSSFNRNTRVTPNDANIVATDTMPKVSLKNVTGFSYRLNFDNQWNVALFGKHYLQHSKGPKETSGDTSHPKYEIFSETFTAMGYGIAGTYFYKDFQGKLSYEKTCRLPTDNELFGNEELERGSTGLKAENSDNYNVSLSYNKDFDKTHFLYIDAGYILRNTKDYIRRVTDSYSGKYFASYINHGYVRNVSLEGELRYSYKNIVTAGVNATTQNIRDNAPETMGTSASTTYKARIPNIPYFFASGDIEIVRRNFIRKANHLSFGYNANYVHEFPLYSERHGSSSKRVVPTQFSHDIQITYTIANGRYNLTAECKNLTDEKLYDNFSLQKPGRAFYIKMRYSANFLNR